MSYSSISCPNQLFPIPAPPTSSLSCAVPLGGSNTTILDSCCNGHINRIIPYSTTPDRNGTYLVPNGCYLFCTPEADAMEDVKTCLAGLLEDKKEGEKGFECFDAKERKSSLGMEGYNSAAAAQMRGAWVAWGVFGLGLLGTLVGVL
jgi:hypothetical protein